MSLEETGLPRVCRPRHGHAFSRNFTVLAGLLQEKAPGWQQACSVTALKILKDLAPESHAASEPSGPDDRLTEKRVGDALDFINVNYKKRLGVAQLSRIAKMHPAHFNRLFKRATGLTPHRYVLEKKIEKAKDFLLHFNESLTTTAVELGFHDYSHFCRVFRNITGTNPRQYKATASGARASGRFSRPSPG